MKETIKILDVKTIYSQPEEYVGWPSLCHGAGDDVWLAFSGGRECHVCPYGVIKLMRSPDGGCTWRVAKIVANTANDDRDPGLLWLGEDGLLLTWFSVDAGERLKLYRSAYAYVVEGWERHLGKLPMEARIEHRGNWARIYHRGDLGGILITSIVRTPHGAVLLADGRLLLVGRAGLRLVAAESRDRGRTWQEVGEIPWPDRERIDLDEASTVALPGGRLVSLWRSERIKGRRAGAPDTLYQTTSDDGGRTWDVPLATEVEGFPPHLLVMSDGRILCLVGWRQYPYGVRGYVSPDGGDTWGAPFTVIDDAASGDCGYPCSVAVGEREFITVWYEAKNAWHASIKQARWRLT